MRDENYQEVKRKLMNRFFYHSKEQSENIKFLTSNFLYKLILYTEDSNKTQELLNDFDKVLLKVNNLFFILGISDGIDLNDS